MSIQFNADALIDKASQLVQAHGGQAVEIAAKVVQVDSINSLSGIPACGAVAGFSVWASFRLWRMGQFDMEGRDWDTMPQHLVAYLGAVAAMVVAAYAAALFAVALFDVWAWVGLFDPKLALAHQVLLKVAQP